ncbi:MAG: histidine--tRNA ligase [Thermoplasmata archaeon]|nr:MAG: histidine--tRNA ligase [Thermoplasmata archaeon]
MIQKPRGTRDFLPEDMAKRREIEEILRGTAQFFGYSEISTPAFENAELFIIKSGQEIVDQLYSFKDKSDRELALRPELTAPTMRLYLAEMKSAPQPVKVYYFGNAFRYERPQKGRFREFWQFGLELIGSDSVEAEAEVITVAVKALMYAGLKNLELRIGHLGILKGIFKEAGLPETKQSTLMKLLDKGETDDLYIELDSVDEFSAEQRDLVKNIINTKLKIADLDSYKAEFTGIKESASAWEKLIETTKILNYFQVPQDSIIIDLNIARGLEYYDGIVFEIDVPELGAEKQVCGGGAYSLLELFGGKPAPTIGFAIGFDRLIMALEEQGRPFSSMKPSVFVIPVGKEALSKGIEIASDLRATGIATDLELKGRGPSKSLKFAANLGVKFAVIIGESELAENNVTVKNMESGDQEKVKIQELIEHFKKFKA